MSARWLLDSMIVLGVVASRPALAASTSAHAMIVSGVAQHSSGGTFDCATSGPQPAILARFNTGVGLPTEGYSYCNLAGGIQDTNSATGASTASQTLSNSFSNGVHNQTAAAIADFGVLKASSSGSYTGNASGGFAYHAGEAAAMSSDTLAKPTAMRSIQFGLTIDGSASVATTSQVLTFLNYQINGGPIFGMFTVDVLGNNSSRVADIFGQPVAGFTVTPTGVSGSGTVYTFVTEVAAGPTFDLSLGLYAASYPSPFGGVANNDFSETARLSSIQMFDANGAALAFAPIVGASGRIYDANGVHIAQDAIVPEPATWALFITGLGITGGMARRKRRNAQPG